MELAIDSIEIGERYRKELGDIEELAENIEEVGLLQPIAVTADHRLIAGNRRIAAFRLLGRDTIPVTIVPLDDLLAGEYAENVQRKAFTPLEMAAIGEAMEERVRALALERKRTGKAPSEESSGGLNGDTRDIVGKALGIAGGTYDKLKQVAVAAREDPETYGPVAEEMDRTGVIEPAYQKVKNRKGGADKSREATRQRHATIVGMGKEHYTVEDIAETVGVSTETVTEVLKKNGIQTTSQRIGATPRFEVNRAMEGFVNSVLVPDGITANLLNRWDGLDTARFSEWGASLTVSIAQIRKIRDRLRTG